MTALPPSQIMDRTTGAAARFAQESIYGGMTGSLKRAHVRIRKLEATDVLARRVPLGITTDALHAHIARFGTNGYLFLWSSDDTILRDDAPQWRHNSINLRTNCANLSTHVCWIESEEEHDPTRVEVECPVPETFGLAVAECTNPNPLAMPENAAPVPPAVAPRKADPNCRTCGGKGVLPARTRRADVVPMGGAALAILGAVALPSLGLPASLHDVLMMVGAGLIGATVARSQGLAPSDGARAETSPCCWCCEAIPVVPTFVPDGYMVQCMTQGEDIVCVDVPYKNKVVPCEDPGCFDIACTPCAEPEALRVAGILWDLAAVCPAEVAL